MVNNTVQLYSTTGIYLSTLCSVVREQNKQGIAAYNFKQYSFRILFLGVVHFRGQSIWVVHGLGLSVLSITNSRVSRQLTFPVVGSTFQVTARNEQDESSRPLSIFTKTSNRLHSCILDNPREYRVQRPNKEF